MNTIILASISDTIKEFQDKIDQAQSFAEKVGIFWQTYKVWILVGLVVLLGIIVFVNLIEANKRREDRKNKH